MREDIEVLKRSSRLSSRIYEELKNLQNFGFQQQITQYGLVLTDNILASLDKESASDTRAFLSDAQTSCSKLRDQIHIGTDIGYIDKSTGQRWLRETNIISSMISHLIEERNDFYESPQDVQFWDILPA